jgi:hypothetical protein
LSGVTILKLGINDNTTFLKIQGKYGRFGVGDVLRKGSGAALYISEQDTILFYEWGDAV